MATSRAGTEPKKLIEIASTDEARRVKWDLGRAAHGEIMELDPLEELYGEFIDGINYCNVLLRDGQFNETHKHELRMIAYELRNRATTLRAIYTAQKGRRIYVPTIHPFV